MMPSSHPRDSFSIRSDGARRFHAFCALLLLALLTGCANIELEKTIKDALMVRRSLTDKNGSGSPAVLQFTDPAGEERVYRIDAGVGWNGLVDAPWTNGEFTVGFEAHKNTTISKEQDSVAFKAVYDESRNLEWLAPVVDIMSPVYSLAYVRDLEKGTESLVPSIELLLLDKQLYLGHAISRKGPDVSLVNTLEPSLLIGLHQEAVLDDNDDATGAVTRGYVDAALVFYPGQVTPIGSATGILGPNDEDYAYGVRLRAGYRLWHELAEDSKVRTDDDTFHVLRIAVEIAPSRDQHWGIALQYQEGQDPIEGLPAQEFVSLGLTAKF